MKCDELLQLLSEYIDGDVDPAICEELEKHLGDCGPCRVVVDTMRRTVHLYQEDKEQELPAPFRERLHEALRDRWKERTEGREGEMQR
jgi:anti-sigma factor RsiW